MAQVQVMGKPYADMNPEQMILRDHLARDRTVLANERTLLAYVRTAIALFAAGGTLLELFPDVRHLRILGSILLVLGVLTLAVGVWRFVAVGRRLRWTSRSSATLRQTDEKNQP